MLKFGAFRNRTARSGERLTATSISPVAPSMDGPKPDTHNGGVSAEVAPISLSISKHGVNERRRKKTTAVPALLDKRTRGIFA